MLKQRLVFGFVRHATTFLPASCKIEFLRPRRSLVGDVHGPQNADFVSWLSTHAYAQQDYSMKLHPRVRLRFFFCQKSARKRAQSLRSWTRRGSARYGGHKCCRRGQETTGGSQQGSAKGPRRPGRPAAMAKGGVEKGLSFSGASQLSLHNQQRCETPDQSLGHSLLLASGLDLVCFGKQKKKTEAERVGPIGLVHA